MSRWPSKKIIETYPNRKKFVFFIVTEGGEQVIWKDLTEMQASKLNSATKLHPPGNLLRFGFAKQPEEPKENKV
jgi:hypothetical protein